MLVLSRKLNESIIISDKIEVIVLDIREGQVKLGIKAPRDVSIHRQEVYAEIRAENLKAQQQDPEALASALDAMKGKLKRKSSPPSSQNSE